MDERSLAVTRRSLHGVAELILAGSQHRNGGGIRLRILPGGFGTVNAPDLRVETDTLVTPTGSIRLIGTYTEVAAAAGVGVHRLDDVYSGGPKIPPDEQVEVDLAAARLLTDAFVRGDAALRTLDPLQTPVLWPEHFDVGITLDEVNYGVSPGDDAIPEPYAYVGPWTPRTGDFWNATFGATRLMTELAGTAALTNFFETGRSLAALPAD